MSPPSPQRRRRRRPSILMSAGDLQQLIAECDAELALDPNCVHTWAVRGHACIKAKMWEQAARDFEKVLHRCPDDESARFSRGMALFKGGHVEDALHEFSRVLELNPAHIMARYARAGCYNSEGEYQQAIQEYWLALRHDEEATRAPLRLDRLTISNNSNSDSVEKNPNSNSCSESGSKADAQPVVNVGIGADLSIKSSTQEPMSTCPRTIPPGNSDETKEAVSQRVVRKVVQVRVNLSQFASAVKTETSTARLPDAHKTEHIKESVLPAMPIKHVPTENPASQVLQASAQQRMSAAAIPRVVRRVTVVL